MMLWMLTYVLITINTAGVQTSYEVTIEQTGREQDCINLAMRLQSTLLQNQRMTNSRCTHIGWKT